MQYEFHFFLDYFKIVHVLLVDIPKAYFYKVHLLTNCFKKSTEIVELKPDVK